VFRNATVIAGVSALATVLVSASAAVAAPAPRLDVYAGDVPGAALSKLVALGVDRSELDLSAAKAGAKGTVHVETILSGRQAAELARQGITLTPKEIGGQTVAQRATAQIAAGLNVYRTYSGPGGLKEEYEQVARRHPLITKLVKIGKTTNGVDIIALKVSLGAPLLKDGAKPSTLYMSAQHAREWITPEMNRRLMHYFVDGYLRNRRVTNLINTTELWFVPVSNPDGYDFTFQPDQRLWRKNLRDNNGDGQITDGDGVDPNRNFDYKWGYDNEGSSDDPASETYRGPGPNSEPESKALDNLFKRVGGFTEFVNYHSAAELILYGVGWQVNTPTPDDLLGIAMSGDDAHPAIPGYDPDIAAELYTTNGEVDSYFVERYGAFGFTPEMSTCADAADSVPDDEWVAADCGSDFEFPDDEDLIQAEFEKNIPFALAVAESAKDPDDPVSVVGRKAPDFEVDSFDVSYGDPQTVAVTAKRALKQLRLNYKINGGKTKTAPVSEWKGGETYGGDENDHYYAEFRGQVKGTRVGDKVQVWFSGSKRDKWRHEDVESAAFTYRVKGMGAKVLVIADEDYNGLNPAYPNPTGPPLKYGQAHLDAVRAAGYSADLWDVDAQGVPHDLGVLSHYKAVVWYLGDNHLTQDLEDVFTTTPFGNLLDLSVAEREQYLTLAVRDFLNEGGKLIHAGETAQYEGFPGISDVVGGLYYGRNGDPTAECVVNTVAGFFNDCLLMANDFRQYWLGAYDRLSLHVAPDSVDGIDKPVNGYHAGLAATPTNPLDEVGLFDATSDVLPPDQFPQFASSHLATQFVFNGDPFAPNEGSHFAQALHQDQSYMRLQRTIDLSGVTAADAPSLQFDLSYSTEDGFDHVIVEAHNPGLDNWTTLPDANGGTRQVVPEQCDQGFLLEQHPFLTHYLTLGNPCTPSGTTGAWNSFTGTSQGWTRVKIDLSAYAGQKVELAISYVTDPGTGGVGAFVDDTELVIANTTRSADGFEGASSEWTVAGPPAGSLPNLGNWELGAGKLDLFSGTATDDTLLLGFGLEQIAAPADRTKLVKQALGGLGVR
jgi:hypothetical protein